MTDLHESGLYVHGLILSMVLVFGAIMAALYAFKREAYPELPSPAPVLYGRFHREWRGQPPPPALVLDHHFLRELGRQALLRRARDYKGLRRWEYAIQDLVHYINDVGPLHPNLLEAAHDLHDCLLHQQLRFRTGEEDVPSQDEIGVQPSPVANYRRRSWSSRSTLPAATTTASS
ncbi:unnamed protein product [Ectocarpus sp. 4 AP-2014]